MKRAMEIFSLETIAALNTFKLQGVSGFLGADETINFMKNINKWIQIHDIGILTQWRKQRLPNKKPFNEPDDPRLKWLQDDFLPWLEEWKSQVPSENFFTNETYEASSSYN